MPAAKAPRKVAKSPEKSKSLDQSARWECRFGLAPRARTVRLTQLEIAGLFPTTKQNVSLHAKNIFEDGELAENSVVKESLTTAAELIVDRANPDEPNMALTTWSGSRVRKRDIIVAKNYLTEDEKRRRPVGVLDGRRRATGARRVRSRAAAPNQVDTLNRLVVIFLEQAELRAKQQQDLTLDFWRSSVDRMLSSNDQPLLDGHEAMKTIAAERYDSFDAKRRKQEAIDADAEDLKAIEDLEKHLKRKGRKS